MIINIIARAEVAISSKAGPDRTRGWGRSFFGGVLDAGCLWLGLGAAFAHEPARLACHQPAAPLGLRAALGPRRVSFLPSLRHGRLPRHAAAHRGEAARFLSRRLHPRRAYPDADADEH